MRVSIVNITKRLQVDLLTTTEYKQKTGYHPNNHTYSAVSQQSGYMWLQTWSGLLSSGSSVSNTTLKAINTNGEYFAGNSWGPTTFTLNFKVINNNLFQKLNETIKYKNEPLYVEVETDKVYYMWCIVDDGSGIEAGELTFISALDGTGTYWSTGDKQLEWHPNEGPGLVQSGPQNLLGDNVDRRTEDGYDIYSISRYITAEQLPIVSITAPYFDFNFTHVNSGVKYTENPDAVAGGEQVYVFDSRTRTTTYQGNIVDYTPDYIKLTGGMEYFEFKVVAGEDISDVDITITYEDLYSTVYGG